MALTGAIFNGECLEGNNEAQDAWFSIQPAAQLPGSTSYLNEFTKEGGVWKYKSWSYNASGVATLRFNVAAPLPTFQGCDPAQDFLDGATIGWGIAAAVTIAACIKLMEKSR